MEKNKKHKQYDVTVVGGGLTGKLMISILIKSGLLIKKNYVGLIQKNKLVKIKE